MRRGTTPTHIFTTDIDLRGAAVLYLTYKQDQAKVLEKTIEDVTIEEDKLTVTLTQQETLMFNTTMRVEMQIRVRFPDGSELASNIMRAPVERILKGGVI